MATCCLRKQRQRSNTPGQFVPESGVVIGRITLWLSGLDPSLCWPETASPNAWSWQRCTFGQSGRQNPVFLLKSTHLLVVNVLMIGYSPRGK